MLALSNLLLIFELHHIYARAGHAQMTGTHANFRVAHLQTLSTVCNVGRIDILILLLAYLGSASVA